MLRHLESITVLRGGIPFIAVLLWVAVAVEPDPFASTRRNRVLKKLRPEVEIQAEAEAQESVDFVRPEEDMVVNGEFFEGELHEGESVRLISPLPGRTGFLAVQLSSRSGEPVSGAKVRAVDFLGAEWDLITDQNGVADFGEVSTGSWRLLWHRDGERVAVASPSLVEDARLKVLLKDR